MEVKGEVLHDLAQDVTVEVVLPLVRMKMILILRKKKNMMTDLERRGREYQTSLLMKQVSVTREVRRFTCVKNKCFLISMGRMSEHEYTLILFYYRGR